MRDKKILVVYSKGKCLEVDEQEASREDDVEVDGEERWRIPCSGWAMTATLGFGCWVAGAYT